MANDRETTYNHIVGERIGTFYTAERKHINRIHKLKEQFPNEVDIQHINTDGSLIANIPITWFKITPKKPRNMSQEQRDSLRDRMANMRQK